MQEPPVDVLPVSRATPLAVTLSFWVDGTQSAKVLEVELPTGAVLDRLSVAIGTGSEASLLLSIPFGLNDGYEDDDELCGDVFMRSGSTIYCDLPADHEGHHTAAGIGSWARG